MQGQIDGLEHDYARLESEYSSSKATFESYKKEQVSMVKDLKVQIAGHHEKMTSTGSQRTALEVEIKNLKKEISGHVR